MILEQQQLANELRDLFAFQVHPQTGASDLFLHCVGDSRAYCPSLQFLCGEWADWWRTFCNQHDLLYRADACDCDDYAEQARCQMVLCQLAAHKYEAGLAFYPADILIQNEPLNLIAPGRHATNLVRVSDGSKDPLDNWYFWEPQNWRLQRARVRAAARTVRLLYVRL